MFDTKESKLLNKVIKSVSMPDDTKLIFTLEDGEKVNWNVWGDCCSETWFENITGIGLLSGNKVVEIIEKEFPDGYMENLRAYRQELDQLYGYTLKVEINSYGESKRYETVDIEFRNSSNGYYGGSLDES